VVGDDPHSEIKAAKELGIETVLYNHNREQPELNDQKTIHSFKGITPYLN
jgi:FMN phosphatase YigB (HAD superfamily)